MCGNPLFSSEIKYDFGSAKPSFTDVLHSKTIITDVDTLYGIQRIEVKCANCDAHLGHVFKDGLGKIVLR